MSPMARQRSAEPVVAVQTWGGAAAALPAPEILALASALTATRPSAAGTIAGAIVLFSFISISIEAKHGLWCAGGGIQPFNGPAVLRMG